MIDSNKKQLSPGTWFFCGPFPDDTTEEQLSEFLCQHGVEVGPEGIAINPRRDGHASAIVSVSNQTFLNLIAWALNGDKFHGWEMNVRCHQKHE